MKYLILKLAFRNIFRNRLRSIVAIFSVAIGILGISFSEAFIADSLHQMQEGNIYSGLGHFQIFKDGYDKYFFKNPEQFLFEDKDKFNNHLSDSGALILAPRLKFAAILTSNDRDYAVFAEAGIPSIEQKTTDFFEIIDGNYYQDSDTLKILVGEGVAKAQRLKAGDWVTINTRAYSGSVNVMDFQIAGVFRSISEIYDNRGIWFILKDAQVLMDTNKIHSIVGLLKDTPATEGYIAKIKPQVLNEGLIVKPWSDLADFYSKTVDLFKIQLWLLEIVIFFMIFLVLNQSLSTSFYERIREISVMRALGDRSKQVFKLLTCEVLILNGLGVFAGLFLTYISFQILNINGITMPPPPNKVTGWTVHLTLTPEIYFKSVVAILFSTLAASVWPIYRTVSVSVIKGLSEDT